MKEKIMNFTDALIEAYDDAEKAAIQDYNDEQKQITNIEKRLNDMAKELEAMPLHIKKIFNEIDEQHKSKLTKLSDGVYKQILSILKRPEAKGNDDYIESEYGPKEESETRLMPVFDDPKRLAKQVEGFIDFSADKAAKEASNAEPTLYDDCESENDITEKTMAALAEKGRVRTLQRELPDTEITIKPDIESKSAKVTIILGDKTGGEKYRLENGVEYSTEFRPGKESNQQNIEIIVRSKNDIAALREEIQSIIRTAKNGEANKQR